MKLALSLAEERRRLAAESSRERVPASVVVGPPCSTPLGRGQRAVRQNDRRDRAKGLTRCSGCGGP